MTLPVVFHSTPPSDLINRLDDCIAPGNKVFLITSPIEIDGSLDYLRQLNNTVSVWHSPISIEAMQAFAKEGRLSAVRLVIHKEEPQWTQSPVVIGAAVLLHQPDLASLNSPDPAGIHIPQTYGARLIIAIEYVYRQRGAEKYLIEKAATFLRPEDQQVMTVEVENPVTQQVFENLGFERHSKQEPLTDENIVLHKFFENHEI